jgi:hypothetical protein
MWVMVPYVCVWMCAEPGASTRERPKSETLAVKPRSSAEGWRRGGGGCRGCKACICVCVGSGVGGGWGGDAGRVLPCGGCKGWRPGQQRGPLG